MLLSTCRKRLNSRYESWENNASWTAVSSTPVRRQSTSTEEDGAAMVKAVAVSGGQTEKGGLSKRLWVHAGLLLTQCYNAHTCAIGEDELKKKGEKAASSTWMLPLLVPALVARAAGPDSAQCGVFCKAHTCQEEQARVVKLQGTNLCLYLHERRDIERSESAGQKAVSQSK